MNYRLHEGVEARLQTDYPRLVWFFEWGEMKNPLIGEEFLQQHVQAAYYAVLREADIKRASAAQLSGFAHLICHPLYDNHAKYEVRVKPLPPLVSEELVRLTPYSLTLGGAWL